MHKEKVLAIALMPIPPLLLAILLTTSCGAGNGSNGEQLSSEEYFQVFAKANARANEEVVKVGEVPLPDSLEGLMEFAKSANSIIDDFINSLKGVTPPAELKSHHDKFLEVLIEGQAVPRDFSDDIEEVEFLAEAEPQLTEMINGLDAVDDAEVSACLALQEIADGKALEIDLACED